MSLWKIPRARLHRWNGFWSDGNPNPHFGLFFIAAALPLPSEMPSPLSLKLKPWGSPGGCRALELPARSWRGGGSEQGAGERLALRDCCLPQGSGEFPSYSSLPDALHGRHSRQEIRDRKIYYIPVASQCNSSSWGSCRVTYSTPEVVPMGTTFSPHVGFLYQTDMGAAKAPGFF